MKHVHNSRRNKCVHIPAWPCDQAVQPAFYLKRVVLYSQDTIDTVFNLQLIQMIY